MNVVLKKWQAALLVTITLFSISTSIIMISDLDKPAHYNLLFLLPLMFSFIIFVFAKVIKGVLNNLGLTIILMLLFMRLVVSPFFLFLGGYIGKIAINVNQNTQISILLVIYETVAIISTLFLLISKEKQYTDNITDCAKLTFVINKKYISIIFVLVLFQIAIFIYTPEILEAYRSIFDIKNKNFTHLEYLHIIRRYATSFPRRFSLVTGRYLMNLLKLIFPAAIILLINGKKKSNFRLYISYIVILTQFLMIDDAIARSFIYSTILFMLLNYIYSFDIKYIAKILILASIAVIAYWIIRLRVSDYNFFQYFSINFNAYFSGVNIVSGSFNLPRNIELRLKYFLYDYLKSIPYGNTIFSLDDTDMAIFFNSANGTYGQIPTTIGSGYYYFGFLLAPIYSVIFTIMAYKMGVKLNRTSNLISKTRYLFLIITFAMGIIMYNIQITLTMIFSTAVPMYIIERIAYGSPNKWMKATDGCGG